MLNKIHSIQCSIDTSWIGSKKRIVLEDIEEAVLDAWLCHNSHRLFLDTWDFNVGLSDSIINLQFVYLPEEDIMEKMAEIQAEIYKILSDRKEVK